MKNRFRITVLWLTAAFVLAMSALSFAKVGDNHGSDVSSQHKPAATPSASPTVTPGDDQNENEPPENESSGEHPLNHGFYVSSAAHCENVDDPSTPASPDFTAPADCATNGQAHGKYVSGVAKSDVGRSNKGHGGDSGDGS
jgi:hypothetical protein